MTTTAKMIIITIVTTIISIVILNIVILMIIVNINMQTTANSYSCLYQLGVLFVGVLTTRGLLFGLSFRAPDVGAAPCARPWGRSGTRQRGSAGSRSTDPPGGRVSAAEKKPPKYLPLLSRGTFEVYDTMAFWEYGTMMLIS